MMGLRKMITSNYLTLVKKYAACKACGLWEFRRNVVIGRGTMPASVMFIGEAPGKSEDLIGEAFVGPSRRTLDEGIRRASKLAGLATVPSYFITNVVGCRPTNRHGGNNREPTNDEAWACWPRLQDIYLAVNPKAIVFLGRVAERHCKEPFPFGVHLQHPAFINRVGGTESAQFRAFVRNLSVVFEKVSHDE